LKIAVALKHEYRAVTNGCSEAEMRDCFSVMAEETLQRSMMWVFFSTLMAKSWSDPSRAAFFTGKTMPNPASPRTLTGWKLCMETFGCPALALLSHLKHNHLNKFKLVQCIQISLYYTQYLVLLKKLYCTKYMYGIVAGQS
jgi:hypothetical protein